MTGGAVVAGPAVSTAAKGLVLPGPAAQKAFLGELGQWRVPIRKQPDRHHWAVFDSYKLRPVVLVCATEIRVRWRHSATPKDTVIRQWEEGSRCPFGKPGASLYVRETCSTEEYREYDPSGAFSMTTGELRPYRYRAAGQSPYERGWIASTSMHEGASRTLLRLTTVEVAKGERGWEWVLGLERVEAEAAA